MNPIVVPNKASTSGSPALGFSLYLTLPYQHRELLSFFFQSSTTTTPERPESSGFDLLLTTKKRTLVSRSLKLPGSRLYGCCFGLDVRSVGMIPSPSFESYNHQLCRQSFSQYYIDFSCTTKYLESLLALRPGLDETLSQPRSFTATSRTENAPPEPITSHWAQADTGIPQQQQQHSSLHPCRDTQTSQRSGQIC